MIRSIQIKSFAVILAAFALCSCVKPSDGGTPSPTVTADWKEGYGGDSVALEALQIIDSTCLQARKLRPFLLKRAMETDKDVVGLLCGLLNSGELNIESVLQPNVDGVEKDAANYPQTKPKRLEIKKAYWKDPQNTPEAKEKMILHEVMPLIGLTDKDYVRSSRLRVALDASRGIVGEVACDRDRVSAVLAGITRTSARILAGAYAKMRCHAALEAMTDGSRMGDFEELVERDLNHAFIYGTVVGLSRTIDAREIGDFESIFMDSLALLAQPLTAFSPEFCAMVSPAATKEETTAPTEYCGGIGELLVGATPLQVRAIVGGGGTRNEYDRTSMTLIARIRSEAGLAKMFFDRIGGIDQIDKRLIMAAIRSQNWNQLYLLGRMQAEKTPGFKVSKLLLKGIDILALVREAKYVATDEGIQGIDEFLLCDPYSIMDQVELVLDGTLNKLICSPGRRT